MTVQLTCPACGKADQRTTACSRCGCDLSHLQEVSIRAFGLLQQAQAALTAARWEEARQKAGESWKRLHTLEAAEACFAASTALNDTTSALSWLQMQEAMRSKDARVRFVE